MLRTAFGLHCKSTLSEVLRLWLGGGQSRCTLWHSSVLLSSSKKTSDSNDSSSSSSSDSETDGADLGEGVDDKLKAAAEGVARSVPKHGPSIQSDLLKQLQSFAKVSKDQAAGALSSGASASKLSDLLSGMQVQKTVQRGKQADRDFAHPRTGGMPAGRQQSYPNREKVKLFQGPGLGIFTSDDTAKAPQEKVVEVVAQPKASLWERVQQEQLETSSRRPPTNAFEELIQWTQEGKLWQFPINNEQGMEEEAQIVFHQHVFLEDQIRDFPRRGPIRHFMDLVLVGLAKNPFLTVQQKHQHIDWFRQYFREKEDVLKESLGQDGLIAPAKAS
ncbi:hypothetical protein ACOMHN_048651 [Nucella lapillus]